MDTELIISGIAIVVGLALLVACFFRPGIAAVLAVVLLLLAELTAKVDEEAGTIALVAAGVLVLIAAFGPRRGNKAYWAQLFGRYVLALVGGGFLLAAIAEAFGGLVLPAMVVAVLLTIALVRYVLVSRRAVALDVFAVIGSAMRQNLPLEAVLAGEVMVQRGLIRRVLHRVGRDLQGGSTLAAALDKHFPHCPGYALAAVAVAEPIHQLPAAVERVQERIADEARARDLTSGIVVYPLLMLLLMGGVMGTVGTFVLPSFASIFSDMGADVPLQRWWDPVMDYSRLVTTVIVLVLLPATLYLTMRPRRPSRPWFFSRVGDWLRWHVPLIRGSARNEAMMETTAFLRMALAAGRPLHEAAADAAELDVNLRFRRRLRQWAQRLQRGEDPADAVRAAQVGEALAFAFDGRVNGGDPQSVLEMVENGSRGRYQLRKKVLQQTVAVLVILTMAAFVTVVILAAMLPLVRLQEILME